MGTISPADRGATICARPSNKGSADLQIGKALALQFRDRRPPRRHEFQERVLLGLCEIDVVALVGDLAEIGLDAELGEPDDALVELRIDLVVGPGRAGEIAEEELDARAA